MSVPATWALSCSPLCNWEQLVLLLEPGCWDCGEDGFPGTVPTGLQGAGSGGDRWWAAGLQCGSLDGQCPTGPGLAGQVVKNGGRCSPGRGQRELASCQGPVLLHQELSSQAARTLGLSMGHTWLLALPLTLCAVGSLLKLQGLRFPIYSRGYCEE